MAPGFMSSPQLSTSATSGIQSSGSTYGFDASGWTVNLPSGGLSLGVGSSSVSPLMLLAGLGLAWFVLRRYAK